MHILHFLGPLWAGLFLANFVPHFVHGISGDRFPTPFSKPRGKGLSSPTLNVVWALVNLIVGYLLFRTSNISADNIPSLIFFFLGIAVISIGLSRRFANKEKE
jgi:hypothetical protein